LFPIVSNLACNWRSEDINKILCILVHVWCNSEQKLSLWTVEDNYLRASFDIVCPQNRQMVSVCTACLLRAIDHVLEIMQGV